MAKRLIDADGLIAILEEIADEDETKYFHLDEITQEIFDAPTVDAVEVVRCKDCRFWQKDTVSCDFVTADTNWYEEDFCSYGERK